MNRKEQKTIEQIVLIFNEIFYGKKPDLINVHNCPESLHNLVYLTNKLVIALFELRDFIIPLSHGEIEVAPPDSRNFLAAPIKELQSQLRNLAWQVHQVAKGDYNQRVYFMGEFSHSFNKMVESLEEKERLLSKRLEDNIQYYSKYDPLTKVPNRSFFEENYNEFFKLENSDVYGALILIDVDNLNFINDTNGHMIGDMILVHLVSILKENLQDDNLLARIGGDEFIVLLHNFSLEDAKQVAEKLRNKVENAKFHPYNSELLINYTISIGISEIRKSGMELREVISRADYALHKSKEQGRNCISYITEEQASTAGLDEIKNLILSIKDAIISGKFQLYFQPIVNINTGEIVHYEGLMRIIDKNSKVIYPGKAIPVAERFGLMTFIDRHIINLAFEALENYPEIKLFINLSGSSIGDQEILSVIKENIKEKGINPSRIGFEITETMAVKELASADRWINNLRELGCKFALDDFGIGFSTFSYLQYLSVDYVKIDGSYVHDIEMNNKNRALVQAINTVAISFGKKVIAEFVENSNILNILWQVF